MSAENEDHDDILGVESKINYIEERNFLLEDVPYTVVKKAWFTLSHLLLDEGSKVANLGCGDGQLTYAMAALNPKVKFIGVDKSKKIINKAKEKYQLHNLDFKIGDVSGEMFDENSLDAIINSFTLHQVYSNARYNQRIVTDTLRKHFAMLKDDGIMFIRDYAKPSDNEFVLIEMHDKEGYTDELEDLSEVELLVWYAENAQPKQDPGCGGFFLEELPPRFPKTRLFRLPYKWAYEFIMRKDEREIWTKNLPFEFTCFSVDEFRKELSSLGAQMQYSAPHWDEEHIRRHFEGHFRLMKTNGDVIGDPPTSFIAVARKKPERSSLNVHERRIAYDEVGELDIKTLRDTKDGTIVDVVTRGKDFAEILPYRLDDEGRLYVYLHDGIIRGISNAISRSGENIDGREWSGHMLEAISTEHKRITDMGEKTKKNSRQFAKSYLGMTSDTDAIIEEGAFYYPDPNYIDERVSTYFIKIKEGDKRITPKRKILETHDFKEKGVIREFNAQNVLDAIIIGLIPNARLELQILSLMQKTKVRAENWIKKDISIASGEISQDFEISEFLRQATNNDKRFKEVKGSAGQLRTINSIFVEEGQSQGGRTGISSETIDFVLSDEKTINTAVVLPITRSTKRDIHAGFIVKHMPVPQRFEGNGISLSVPQFNIPKEITNYRMLKQFIAEKFGVTPNMVLKLGESYFSHVGITPHRIHPFAIAAPPEAFRDPKTKFIPFFKYMLLWRSLSKEQHFMTTIARAYMRMPEHIALEAKRNVKLITDNIFKTTQPDWSLPMEVPQSEEEIMAIAMHDEDNIDPDEDATDKPKKSKEKKAKQGDDKNEIQEFQNELESLQKLIADKKTDKDKPEPEEW